MASDASLITSPYAYPKRPALGRSGKPVTINTNHFKITKLPDNNIHHYDINIFSKPRAPTEEPTGDGPPPRPRVERELKKPILLRKIFQSFEDRYSQELGCKCVYDGKANLYAPKELPFQSRSFEVTLPAEDGNRESTFVLKVKKASVIFMEELHQFLNGRIDRLENSQTISAIDVVFRHRPSMIYPSFGRSFFLPGQAHRISGGLDIFSGYFQSARPTQQFMTLNIDVAATCFYREGPLLNLIQDVIGRDLRPNDNIQPRDLQLLKKYFRHVECVIKQRGETVQAIKIKSFTDRPPSKITFDHKGNEIDVLTYFTREKRMRVEFPNLPCVQSTRGNYYLIEQVDIMKNQRFQRKLNERQTADMIKFTCQKPHLRTNKINNGISTLNFRQNDYLTEFGLAVDNKMMSVNARIMDTPTVQYSNRSRNPTIAPREGSWNLRDRRVYSTNALFAWGVIVFQDERRLPSNKVKNFIRELIVTCEDTGMDIRDKTPSIFYQSPAANTNELERKISSFYKSVGDKHKKFPQLIFCILPNTGAKLYNDIKTVCETSLGVASQCVQEKHVYTPKKQYCANVCLKMNVKVGGINAVIDRRSMPFVSERPTMIMGSDVSHPGPGENRPSIASLVATLDSNVSAYATVVRAQPSRIEIIRDMEEMSTIALKKFVESTKVKPERILVYRDGASEGQFDQILADELSSLKAACAKLENGYSPKITFLTVQKRHHTRFFAQDKRDTDRSENVLPGLVVETTVTHPSHYDFFIQSHGGLQGTSRPSHYYVLWDENKFEPDALQKLTYSLCFMFARCTRSVSIVPPAYYADIAAARARCYQKEIDDSTDFSGNRNETYEGYPKVHDRLGRLMWFM